MSSVHGAGGIYGPNEGNSEQIVNTELTLDLNPQFSSHLLLPLMYMCIIGLGNIWQDFMFVPIKLHIIRAVQCSNVFRSFWRLIQSFHVLSLPLNIMSSVDFFPVCAVNILILNHTQMEHIMFISIFILKYSLNFMAESVSINYKLITVISAVHLIVNC